MGKIVSFLGRHIVAIVILVVAGGGGGYWYYTKNFAPVEPTRYVLAPVVKDSITVSVSGSGQVSASNQVDVKAKASGDLSSLAVVAGQPVTAGMVLATIDTAQAQKAVRNAESDLTSARLNLEKLKKPVDQYSILQAENSIAQSKDALQKLQRDQDLARQKNQDALEKLKRDQDLAYQKNLEARTQSEADLKKSREDGYNTVAEAFLNITPAVTGLNSLLYDTTIDHNQRNIDWYRNQVFSWDDTRVSGKQYTTNESYKAARLSYDAAVVLYQGTLRSASDADIEHLIDTAYVAVQSVADSVKQSKEYLDLVGDIMTTHSQKIPAILTTQEASLDGYTATTSKYLSSLLAIKQSIANAHKSISDIDRDIATNAKQDPIDVATLERDIANSAKQDPIDVASAETGIREKEAALVKLRQGVDPIDIKSQELAIQQKVYAVADARAQLADYTIMAPFDGVVAKLNSKRGDAMSPGTVLATIVTRQQLAEISLSEVDVAKIAIGQKAMLTFDAIPDLTIAGAVAEIDTIGTVTQGVATYMAKIGFETQDTRIKPSMSVSTSIITNVKTDVLIVRNTAIKTQGTAHYVEVAGADAPTSSGGAGVVLSHPPERRTVEIGLVNDDVTEVVSGLTEGELVVVSSIAPKAAATTSASTTQAPALRIPGLSGGAGGGAGALRGTGGR